MRIAPAVSAAASGRSRGPEVQGLAWHIGNNMVAWEATNNTETCNPIYVAWELTCP